MFCLCQSPQVCRLNHSNAREKNARQCSYLSTVQSTWCICSAFASLLRAARRRSISASPVLRPTRTAPQINVRTVGGGHGRPKPVRHQRAAPRSDRARLAANRHGTSALPRQLRPDHIRGAKPRRHLPASVEPLHDKRDRCTINMYLVRIYGGCAVPAPQKRAMIGADRCRDCHG